MPLPGGPSDKLGNRYELRWVVRRLVDLLTGRLHWLRMEPPGEDAIEFRCQSDTGEHAYQVKRGLAGGGHWTISALGDVLDGFGELLAANPDLKCVFGSEHAASELKELTERSRSASDLFEFSRYFLEAKWIEKSWRAVKDRWNTNDEETWNRLRRITVAAAGEENLKENTDTILQLLLDAPAATARAVLLEFALESVHRRVDVGAVRTHLEERGIHVLTTGTTSSMTHRMLPPPAFGIRRAKELQGIKTLLSSGKTVVAIGGLSGIGKTTVAAQFATEANAPICWMDCGLIGSGTEALGVIGEFLLQEVGDCAISKALGQKTVQLNSVGCLAGKHLAASKCVVVWDGVDGPLRDCLLPIIDALSSGGATQLVTAQSHFAPGTATTHCDVHVGRLEKDSVRQLLVTAYPTARIPDLEAADFVTQGHPYQVQLLVGSAGTIDLHTALAALGASAEPDAFVSRLLVNVAENERKLLNTLALFEFPFTATHVSLVGGTPAMLKDLASRYFVVRAGGDEYRVHDLVKNLATKVMAVEERRDAHERIALLLRGLDSPTWFELHAMLRHARAASMTEIARMAGAALLDFATHAGYWKLAQEAAESLVRDPVSANHSYPHFVLGKWNRISENLEAALDHYWRAEMNAESPGERDVARYERASVLCGLGRREEADPLYSELANSDDPGTRVEAHIALAMGVAERGDVTAAVATLNDALESASQAGLLREEAEVQQVLGTVLAGAERWEESRVHLKEAHRQRHTFMGPEAGDIYGWYQLYLTILRVERALGNKDGARSAAHGLYRCSLVSGSHIWEVNAAHSLCRWEEDANDDEVIGALNRLRERGADTSATAATRVSSLVGLVLCEWTVCHYTQAMEAILELAALADEHDIGIPLFGFVPSDGSEEEALKEMPSGFILFLPCGEDKELVIEMVSNILERRSELAQYGALIVSER